MAEDTLQDVSERQEEMLMADRPASLCQGLQARRMCLATAKAENVFVDLRPVWEAIDGAAVREAAARSGNSTWAEGILQSWADIDHITEQRGLSAPQPSAKTVWLTGLVRTS